MKLIFCTECQDVKKLSLAFRNHKNNDTGMGTNFEAFIISEPCDTIKRIK